ncbi:CARDB domain-containing protein [Falsiporphyromonas endometrii]|uniref:CARDB domain-containing protein n=1 Tax=Falsiporphyromonas endometrii TaxID=1387297 RepID=A0ABV9K9F3_9PORP
MKKLYYIFVLLLTMGIATNAQTKHISGQSNLRSDNVAPKTGFCWGNRFIDMNQGEKKYQGVMPPAALTSFIKLPTLKAEHTVKAFSLTWGGKTDDKGQILILDKDHKVIFAEGVTLQNGWQTYALSTPFKLSAGEYFIGILGHTQKSSPYVLPFDGVQGVNLEDAAWIGVEDDASSPGLKVGDTPASLENWAPLGVGSLNFVVDIDGPQTENCAIICNMDTPKSATANSQLPVSIDIRNIGTQAINTADIVFETAGKEQVAKISDIAIGEQKTLSVPYTMPSEGVNIVVNVSLKNINGMPNTLITEKSFSINSTGGEKPHKVTSVLLEEFTTEKCHNCPHAKPIVSSIAKQLTEAGYTVSFAAHHAGYDNDFLTLAESEELNYYVFAGGTTFAPALMINRLAVGKQGGCCANVGVAAENFKKWIDESYQYGEISNIIFTENGMTISGKVYPNVDKSNVYLHIYVCENGIKQQNQVGLPKEKEDSYVHDGVIRKFIYPVTGKNLSINADGSFKDIVPAAGLELYKKESNYVVAFITGPMGEKEKGFDARFVYASNNAKYTGKDLSINKMSNNKPVVFVENNCVKVQGDVDNIQIFDMDGRIVAQDQNTALQNGIYVVRISNVSDNYIYKVQVR